MPHIVYKPYQDPQPPHRLPNKPPSKLPPAPPALPPLLASVSNHSLKYSLFLICSGLVSFVSSCASCLLNANNVGIDVICISSAPFPHCPFRAFLTYHIPHPYIPNQNTIQLDLHKPHAALLLPHLLLLNQTAHERLHSLTRRAPRRRPHCYQRPVVCRGEKGKRV
jgi:hypothetical protein